MKELKKIIKFSFCLFAITIVPAFADVKIISPQVNQNSIFANKQVLVINTTEDEDVYYSFSGTDPLESGFAYDEPILLDLVGQVELRVTSINKKNQRHDFVINYTVDESKINQLNNSNVVSFLTKMNNAGILELECGNVLEIPSDFMYSISSTDLNTSFEKGRDIYVSSDSSLNRYVSLMLSLDDETFWNYVIHLVPVVTGEFSKTAVPFEIIDWSTIKFLDNKYIYAIDDEWWQRYNQEFYIDRSVDHVIKWQSVDYDSLNPIMTFKIPKAPTIHCELQADATVTITLQGDSSYRFAQSQEATSSFLASGIYDKIVVDAFQGENFSTLLNLDVYSDNVYQGQFYASVQVNRKRPQIPQIDLSDSNKICRDDVSFTIKPADDEHFVKYYVTEKHLLSLDELMHKKEYSQQANINSFVDYKNGTQIKLTANQDSPTQYTIYAYSIDKWNNVSDMTFSNVIIDKCTYFVNGASNVSEPDGTFDKPFNNLSKLEEIVNNNAWSKFYIYEKVSVKKLKPHLKRSFELSGIQNACLEFDSDSALYILGGSCTLSNLDISSSQVASDSNSILITVTDGMLFVRNCELDFGRNKSAVMISATRSNLEFNKSGFTVFANDYANVVSASKSNVTSQDSRFSSVAVTNLTVSSKDSIIKFSQNNCSVSGTNSRILELFNSEAFVFNNVFNANKNYNSKKDEPIWKDEKSKLSQEKNRISGF